MSADKTIEALKKFCTDNSGDKLGQIWHGNKATYYWNIGKVAMDGTLNGVVRSWQALMPTAPKFGLWLAVLKLTPRVQSSDSLAFLRSSKRQLNPQ